MTVTELIIQTENQAVLLRTLVESHAKSLRDYPFDYDPISITKMEHCLNSLLTLNEILTKST